MREITTHKSEELINCGDHHPIEWSPRLNSKEKGN